MILALREARAVLGRRAIRLALVVTVLAVLIVTTRVYSGTLDLSPSLFALATSDDQSRYIALITAAMLGAEAGGLWHSTLRSSYSWVAGSSIAQQTLQRVSTGFVLGVLCGIIYWLSRVVGSVITIIGSGHDLVFGDAGPLPIDSSAVWRLLVACGVAAAAGVLIGTATRRPLAAVAGSFVLFGSLLPIVGSFATRVPAIASIQSFAPGGALTTLLESNAGISRASGLIALRSPRSAFGGAAILLSWCAVLWVVSTFGTVLRSSTTSVGSRLRHTGLAGVGVIVAIALVLPPLAREALPWHLQPSWLEAKSRHASSIDVVKSFVSSVSHGRYPVGLVPPKGIDVSDPFWAPLIQGTVVIGPQREMSSPSSVPVVATVRTGSRHTTVGYSFDLEPQGRSWRLRKVNGAVLRVVNGHTG